MLLSSTAESLYWTSRYLERARSIARALQGYESMSLDLPRGQTASSNALLALVGADPNSLGPNADWNELARILVCDLTNPSSVHGALQRARENLRSSRAVLPPAVWTTLNTLHASQRELDTGEPAQVLASLSAVNAGANQIEGELFTTATRDAAYSFWRVGGELERRDMLLRTLQVLVRELVGSPNRMFDDVRWMGILECLGARSMYRRKYHCTVTFESVLQFVLTAPGFPLSVTHGVAALTRQLGRLPNCAETLATVSKLDEASRRIALTTPKDLDLLIEQLMTLTAAIHQAVQSTYFSAPAAASEQPQELKPSEGRIQSEMESAQAAAR
jgi:uncharacterized alpha-E superfamily protein